MDDDQLQPEENQEQRPNSFRDAKNEIHSPTPQRASGMDVDSGVGEDGLPLFLPPESRNWKPDLKSEAGKDDGYDNLSALEKYNKGRQGKDRGINSGDFTSAFDKEGAGNVSNALGKALIDVPKKSAQATSDNVKRISKFAKNKKYLAAGGGAMAMLIPIVMFFMWMMLFKNVHIKNLYVTYRWAQFNRGMSKALKAQLKYAADSPDAKINGTAETTVSPTDSPDEITKKGNAAELGPDAIDPDDAGKVEAEAKRVTSLEQSIEGSADKTLRESGASRSVAPAEGVGDTPEEQAKDAKEKAKANVDDELAKPGADNAPDAPDSLKEAVDEAKDGEESGKTPAQAAADASDKFLSRKGLAGAAQKIQGAGALVTFYCLFRDIYVSAKDQINKIVIGGAVGTAQQLNKTADCQKSGDCDAVQAGAVAEKFDDGETSFTETCGYTRATQSSNPDCKEINPQFAINGFAERVGGNGETAVKMIDFSLDPPDIEVAGFGIIDDTCGFVNSTPGQVVFTLIGGAGFALSGGGWQAAGQALTSGAVQFAGTAGGKALIAHTIMTYGGSLYKDLSPIDMGNLTDMGHMALVSGSCANAWCPQISDAQAAQLDNEYRTERIAANSKRSVLEKFFDTQSPDSVSSRVVLNAPATPKAAIGRIKNVFAAISNPIKLNVALGRNSLAIAKPQTAYAADDNGPAAYGLSGKVTAPPNLLADTSYADVLAWGKGRDLSPLEGKFKNCGGEESESYVDKVSNTNNSDETCTWNNLDDEGKMFFQYKYAQNAAYKTALLHNNQSNAKGAVGGAIGATAASTPGPVFLLGDSIGVRINDYGQIGTLFSAKDSKFSPTTVDASVSRSFNGPGTTTGKKTSALAALDDPANIEAINKAGHVVVQIGTNPAGNVPEATFTKDISDTVKKIKGIKSSVKIYWVNVFSPLIAQRTTRNQWIAKQAGIDGFTVIDTTGLGLKTPDGVHPDVESSKVLAQAIVDKVATGGVGGNAQQVAQQLLDSPQISFTTKDAETILTSVASGAQAPVACKGGTGVSLDSGVLSALLQASQKYTIGIGYITNGCHSTNSKHYAGKAVDINRVNDQRVTGGEKISWDFLSDLSAYLPNGAGFGQKSCGVETNVRLVNQIRIFNDTCTHLHVEME